MTYGHLQADCLYTGISSGPNARCRVWEAFTFTFARELRFFWRGITATTTVPPGRFPAVLVPVRAGGHPAELFPRARGFPRECRGGVFPGAGLASDGGGADVREGDEATRRPTTRSRTHVRRPVRAVMDVATIIHSPITSHRVRRLTTPSPQPSPRRPMSRSRPTPTSYIVPSFIIHRRRPPLTTGAGPAASSGRPGFNAFAFFFIIYLFSAAVGRAQPV